MTLIGAPVRRVEDARLLAGRGRFVADLVLPRMLHAAFLRSPHAQAKIRDLDLSRAWSAPGVAACLTGEDLRQHARPVRAESRMKGYRATDFPPLALGKVRYAGEAAAVVVGESRYAASGLGLAVNSYGAGRAQDPRGRRRPY